MSTPPAENDFSMSLSCQRWKEQWYSRVGEERSVRVRWLLNPECEPLQNVELTEQRGQIVDIRKLGDSESHGILPMVILPPLVNAHTHLEFSTLQEPLQPAFPFPDWIRAVMQWRHTSPVAASDAIQIGVNESRNSGVRLVGEIMTQDDCAAVETTDLRAVLFREAIGLRPERIEQQLQIVKNHLAAERSPNIVRAISPHAPYTVHRDMLAELVNLAIRSHAPIAMHLAETVDELELLDSGRGRFADFLTGLGLFDTATFPGGLRIIDYLRELARSPKALAVHGNYFGDDEILFLSQHPNITTVYCPRTHHYFGHSEHPVRKLLAADCRVVLGTDSRASNPDLSIWKELQHVARCFPEITVNRLVAMVTTHSAEAMGFNGDHFQIRQGGSVAPVFLSFEESIGTIKEIVKHSATRVVTV